MNGQITYQYAYDDAEKITDILQMGVPDRKGPWHCIGCGRRMFAHLKDDVRARHFAHDAGSGCAGPETYYHIMAKSLFLLTFQACRREGRSYAVEREVVRVCTEGHGEAACNYGKKTRRSDIARTYDEAVLEKGWRGYVADCLLTDSTGRKQPCMVEFKVTHGATQAKIADGGQMIEIRIPLDEAESVLDAIRDGYIPKERVHWYGFGGLIEKTGQCRQQAPRVTQTVLLRGERFPPDPYTEAMEALRGCWHGNPLRYPPIPGFVMSGLIVFYDREQAEYVCWDGCQEVSREQKWSGVLQTCKDRQEKPPSIAQPPPPPS